ncbi:MAG: hypothetical protein HS116_15985 [Planctomycetes bacterium]|nr:hypothetical protein [Planctomycetota bacterium]
MQGPWADAEQRLSSRFGLTIFPAEGRLMELLIEEVQQSDFLPEEILAEFYTNPELIAEFSGRWYADCHKRDYGEEWNPEEGNQQEGNPPLNTVGICQGFMVGYTLLYLYAKRNPRSLLDFIKRRRIPHAKKVAKDVMRVFDALGKGNA